MATITIVSYNSYISRYFLLVSSVYILFYLKAIVGMCMGAVQNAAGLLACRFFLGAVEGGLFPGIIYFTSLWYKKKQQAIRLGLFWSFSALAGAFSGVLAYGISQINSTKLSKWRLIFIVSFFYRIRIRKIY
jgi:MFS family permease